MLLLFTVATVTSSLFLMGPRSFFGLHILCVECNSQKKKKKVVGDAAACACKLYEAHLFNRHTTTGVTEFRPTVRIIGTVCTAVVASFLCVVYVFLYLLHVDYQNSKPFY